MDPRAYRIAQEFVRAQVRRARYAPEFLRVVDPQKFRNPETGNDVRFVSLPDDEQKRIYDQWRSKNVPEEEAQESETPETTEEITARNIDIVRNGRETERVPLSSGGRGSGGPVNQSFIVRLEHEGNDQVFIFKPAEGEEPRLRIGIPAGQYHAREQAAYSIDAMLGDGGVVPVTHTRGSDSGSYQLWAEGARAMHGEDLNALVETVGLEGLSSSPDFQRLNVLDLMLGHEDRHRGNLLYYYEGDETPENLRFAAIDNGLSLASPSEHPDHRVYTNPFQSMYLEADSDDEDEDDPFAANAPKSPEEEAKAAEAKKKGNALVAKSLSRISPELHEQIKKLDLSTVAKSMTQAGVDEEGAVRAALVRIAALQADPTIFKDILQRHGGDLDEAWRDFQHLSGFKDDLLYRSGAGEDAERKVDQAVERARPRGGWSQPENLEEAHKAMQEDLEGWGRASPDERTAPAGKPKKDDDMDFSMLASVRDRWLSSFVKCARGQKLIISEVDPRTKKPKMIGQFELGRDGKVKESYRSHRFRREIQSGVRLMGKRFVPKDGAKFMVALQKVYGARSMYDVKRT